MALVEVSPVLQFHINLLHSQPLTWRRILVPSEFTFFEFHVAIQDAMGWKHQHPYEFCGFSTLPGQQLKIQRPFGPLPLSNIDFRIKDYFRHAGDRGLYLYELSSYWVHEIELEGLLVRSSVFNYPMCIGGERACPHEGVGGIRCYTDHSKIKGDPSHPHHSRCVECVPVVGGIVKSEPFDHRSVVFNNALGLYRYESMPPKKRF